MNNTGAVITAGPTDWQIVQQDRQGRGTIALTGTWNIETPGVVEVRLVREDTNRPVTPALAWQPAETRPDGTWSARLTDIPAGGLYRLETHLRVTECIASEWAPRGDMRHFLGVGDLWVIAGQSNSAGYGRGPYQDPPALGVHLFRNNGTWTLATHPMNESTDTIHPVNRENANPGHSPYLQFGRLLQQDLGFPIGLVQTSLGGSPLAWWNPTEDEGACLYDNMIDCIDRVGGRVRGILWYQGESDTAPATADSYGDRFIAAVQAWREALTTPDLPVLTVQLNRTKGVPTPESTHGWSVVREAQRQVPRRLPGVAVVPANDLPLSDGIHNSPAGNMVLGTRLAEAALATAYGRATQGPAPDLEDVVRSAPRELTLTFANVADRLGPLNESTEAYVVEDATGTVPVTAARFPGDATIRLVLGRDLAGPARLSIGVGIDPPLVPWDMPRQMPILNVYRVPVTV